MTTAFWCLGVACLLPYVWVTVGHVGRKRQQDRYDNELPRVQQSECEGWAARAYAAHHNAFEALPVFAVAVFVAYLSGTDLESVGHAAVAWTVLRVVHGALYIANLDMARTLVFFCALGCVGWLFALAATA